ncbi:MAG: AMP-binding protein, partial [Ruthenibacterium sp.]
MYKNILSYLEEKALVYPDKTAFADENTAITFHNLQIQAQRIGTVLSKSIAVRNPVALFMEKSVAAMAGFMGTVYAGCFYVMLDTKHPINRIDAIFKILDSKILLTDEKHYEQAKALGFDGEILRIEELVTEEIDEGYLAEIRAQTLDIDPLYAIFTSGSTGVPKGVVVSHRSTIDFIDCFTQTFHITSMEIIGNQAPFDFDVSVKDIYSGLATGATVQIIPRSYFSFPTKLMDFLCERNVTTLIWAVSALCFVTTMKGLE